jgi:SP family general alpha glucoside:H+ symporter-like MFS transporter
MAQTMAFNYSMAIQSTNILATGTAIYLMGRVGRRKFYMAGIAGIGLMQLIIGIFGVAKLSKSSEGIAVAVGMIIINLTFKLSLGPACYTIIGETPNSRVRAQSVVLARTTYIIGNTVNGQLIPRMLNSTVSHWPLLSRIER